MSKKEITKRSLIYNRNLSFWVVRGLSREGKNTSLRNRNNCGIFREYRGLVKRAQTLIKTLVLALSSCVMCVVKCNLSGVSFLIYITGIIMLVFRIFIEGLT